MEQSMTLVKWNQLKFKLKNDFPQLTNADLQWRDGNYKELLWLISLKVGLSRKELMILLENAE